MVRTQQLDPATLAVVDSLKWVMARSVGFKFRMVALSMLFVWLCGNTAPVAALSAIAIQNNGGKVVLGGVASMPWRVTDVEKYLTGKKLTPDVIDKAAEMALDGAAPLEHNGYKVPLFKTIVARTIRRPLARQRAVGVAP